MYEQIEKPKENKSRAIANSVAQKKSNGKQGFEFVDNRKSTRFSSDFVIQREPMDLETERENNPDIATFYWNVLKPWLDNTEDLHPEASGTIQDIKTDIEYGNWEVYTSWDDINSIVLMVNARINEGAPQYEGEVVDGHEEPLTPVEQFSVDYPNAIQIGIEGWRVRLSNTIGNGHEDIANRAMNDVRACGAVWPNADRISHWTRGRNGGGSTGFVAHVADASFFVALGHHRAVQNNHTYAFDWRADQVGTFTENLMTI